MAAALRFITTETESPMLNGDVGYGYRIPEDISRILRLTMVGNGTLEIPRDKYECLLRHLPIVRSDDNTYRPGPTTGYDIRLAIRHTHLPAIPEKVIVNFSINTGRMTASDYSSDRALANMQLTRIIRNPNWHPVDDWQATPDLTDQIMDYIFTVIRRECNDFSKKEGLGLTQTSLFGPASNPITNRDIRGKIGEFLTPTGPIGPRGQAMPSERAANLRARVERSKAREAEAKEEAESAETVAAMKAGRTRRRHKRGTRRRKTNLHTRRR